MNQEHAPCAHHSAHHRDLLQSYKSRVCRATTSTGGERGRGPQAQGEGKRHKEGGGCHTCLAVVLREGQLPHDGVVAVLRRDKQRVYEIPLVLCQGLSGVVQALRREGRVLRRLPERALEEQLEQERGAPATKGSRSCIARLRLQQEGKAKYHAPSKMLHLRVAFRF